VITLVDQRFRREAVANTLRFTCEHCALFDPDAVACANGYPTEPHREVDLASAGHVLFCKDFELG
jgi:hypothetical protein